ncbi:MAG: DUF6263 family protein [Candidatus Kapaibacteriota bacterium]
MKRVFYFLSLLLIFSCESKKIAEEKKQEMTRKQAVSVNQVDSNRFLLVLNPEIGKEYVFVSKMNQKILQKIDTLSTETNVDQTIFYSLKSIHKDSNLYRFRVKFMDIEQNITSPMISIRTSTRKKTQEPTPLDVFYNTLKGKTFDFTIGKYGENLNLIGVDSLLGNIIEEMMNKKEFKGVDRSLLKQLIGNFFNQKELQKSFEKLFEIYPNKRIEIGDSWKIEKHLSEPVPANIVNNFNLKSLRGDSLFIDLSSDVKFEKTKSKENEPQVKELVGRQSGELIVSKVSGMLLNGRLNQQIKMVHQIPPSMQTNNKALTLVTNINSNFILSLK